MSSLSCETPAPGLFVHQKRRGYRYAMEPFLLAGWVMEGPRPKHTLDVGTGSGVIALLLANQGLPCDGVDVRPDAIHLAKTSAADSGLGVRFSAGDVRKLSPQGHDLAVANPPYFPQGSGVLPPQEDRAIARHELHGSLAEIVEAMSRVAPRIALILPITRANEGRAHMEAAGLTLSRRLDLEPTFSLLEGKRTHAGPPHLERTPLRQDEQPSPRVCALYQQVGARP